MKPEKWYTVLSVTPTRCRERAPPFDRVLGPLCHPPNQSPAWWDRPVPGPSGAAKRARWRDGLRQLRRRGSSRPGQGPGSQSPEGLVGVRGLRAPGG